MDQPRGERPTVNGADAVARALTAEGVKQVFIFPATMLANGLAQAGIRTVLVRQERVAGNMADGVSRSTNARQIGTWAVQALAGSENSFAGNAHSFTDSTPTLYLPGHPGIDRIDETPTFDSMSSYRSTLKFGAKVYYTNQMLYKLRQAFAALRSGRPGPVMLELLEDASLGEFTAADSYRPVPRVRAAADAGAVREAADRLLNANEPFIWAGHGVLYAEASAELREVAELLGAPVMTTLQGKSAFPEGHELAAGVGGYAQTAMVQHFLEASDVLLVVGSSLSHTDFTPLVPDGKVIIHATNDAADLNKAYFTEVPIQADARLFLAQLADELRGRIGKDRTEHRSRTAATIARLKTAWRSEFEGLFSDASSPINGYRMFRELWACLDPNETMITHESGAVRDIQSVFYESTTPRSYLGWGQSSQLGFSLGLAMGAKLANPDKLVVNVMGDGAIGMTGMDWETAVRERIPILTIIKHDSVFSGYRKGMGVAIERYNSAHQTGDYAALARAFGGHGEQVTDVAELRPAILRAIQAVRGGQPALVDVITAETLKLSLPPQPGQH
jgi:thiamine pyrophosphate-dependent acetolactate synthase large subunit-like protein